jgi:hypothetical protein
VDPKTGGVQAGVMQFRNKLINGDMRIHQRGTSGNATNGMFVCDRWIVNSDIPGGFLTRADVQTTDQMLVELGITKYISMSRGSGSGTYMQLQQNIEMFNVRDCIMSQIALSFYAKASSAGSFECTMGWYYTASTLATYSGQTITLTTSWKRYELLFTAPAALTVANTITNIDNLIGMIVALRCTSMPLNSTTQISGVQIEKGSVATPFELRPYPVELQLCQRYGYTIPDTAHNFFGFTHLATTTVQLVISHPITMRIGPTVSLISGSLANMLIQTPQSTNLSPTTVTEATTTISHTTLLFGGLSGLAIGNTVLVRFRHNGVTTLFFNSEL